MKRSLDRQAMGVIAMLVLQYLLGMITNLFVEFPQGVNEGQLWAYAWSQIPLALHIILGILLLTAAIGLLIRASKSNETRWKAPATWGLIFVLIALVGGATFVSSQQEINSYVMAVAFLAALLSYGWGLYRTSRIEIGGIKNGR